jgi:hypothetical protein
MMHRQSSWIVHPAFDYYRGVSALSAGPKHGPTHWIAETVRERGVLGALVYYTGAGFELLRDLSPARRRSRYGDIDFDFDYKVDTTWANIGLRTRLREWMSGGQYQPTEPEVFRRIISDLPVKPDGFTFIDLGSGKGRTLLMASGYPFRRIVGLELLAELDAVARKNIEQYGSEHQKCFAVESHAGDAREFDFPSEPTIVYLFNPFPQHVVRKVLANLQESLRTAPREVILVYHSLIHERVFAECMWLQPVLRTTQYAIYRAGAVNR